MAITKLVSPSTPNPTGTGAGASWDLAMAQLTAVRRFLAVNKCCLHNGQIPLQCPKLALGIYLQHLGGAIYVVDSADYTIPTPSSDGTWYVKLTVSGATLSVSVVNSLSGFAWSSQHNGLSTPPMNRYFHIRLYVGEGVLALPLRNVRFSILQMLRTHSLLSITWAKCMAVCDYRCNWGIATVGGDISASNFESKSVSE